MWRILSVLVIVMGILLVAAGSDAQAMTFLTDEVMQEIKGGEKILCGTETYCMAYPTCIPGIGGCVKLPTSLPALSENPTDNMANYNGAQCGTIWESDCKAVKNEPCGGPIVNGVDP